MLIGISIYIAVAVAFWFIADAYFSSQRLPISEAMYWQHPTGEKNWRAHTAMLLFAAFWPVAIIIGVRK